MKRKYVWLIERKLRKSKVGVWKTVDVLFETTAAAKFYMDYFNTGLKSYEARLVKCEPARETKRRRK